MTREMKRFCFACGWLNISRNNYKLNRMHNIALSPNLICFKIGDIIVKWRYVKNGPETKRKRFFWHNGLW